MKKFQFFFVLLLVSCSGLKEYEEAPLPVGGENVVRSVFQQHLGSAYSSVEGSDVSFIIRVNAEGKIEEVSIKRRTDNENINRKLPFILKDWVRFTPTTKNGKKIPAQFEYNITL